MDKKYVSWHDMERFCLEIVRQMNHDSWKPDLIIGVTRGGAIPAILLSQFLHVKMVGMDVALRDGGEYGPESNAWAAEDAANGKKILIVDDINDSGATINWIVKDWNYSGTAACWGNNVRVATLFDKESSKAVHSPDYVANVIKPDKDEEWIQFPYENWWLK